MKDESQANAQLIASAPELLDVCEDLLELTTWLLAKEEDQYDCRVEEARRVIAKAKGILP